MEASARARFLREARVVAASPDHVVGVHQVGEDVACCIWRCSFLRGETLEERLRRWSARESCSRYPKRRASPASWPRTGRGPRRGGDPSRCETVDVWLEPDGRVKILDFGLARAIEGDPASPIPESSPARPPIWRRSAQRRSCRRPLRSVRSGLHPLPHAGRRGAVSRTDKLSTLMAVASASPPPLRRLNPAVRPALAELVGRLLAKVPANRPASAREVVALLKSPSQRPRISRIRISRIRLAAATCGCAIILSTLAGVYCGQTSCRAAARSRPLPRPLRRVGRPRRRAAGGWAGCGSRRQAQGAQLRFRRRCAEPHRERVWWSCFWRAMR